MEKRRKKLKKSCHSDSICKIDRKVRPDTYILRNSIQFESTMYLCNCVLQSMIELKCKCEQVQKMANLVTPSIDQFRVTKNMILLGIENLLTAPQPKHTQNLDKQKKIDIKLNQSQHHSFLENSIHKYFLCLQCSQQFHRYYKGQLISKYIFVVFNFSKKRTKTSQPEVSQQ